MRGQNIVAVPREQPGEHGDALGRQMPGEIARHPFQRPRQDIAEHEIEWAAGGHRRRPVAVGDDDANQMPHAVQPSVGARHRDGARIDVARQHRHPPQLRRRDGENAGAATEVERPPDRPSAQHLQRPQAALGRDVPAGAERRRRLDAQRERAGRDGRFVFRLPNQEAADAKGRKPLAVLREPIPLRQWLDRDLGRRDAGCSRGYGEREMECRPIRLAGRDSLHAARVRSLGEPGYRFAVLGKSRLQRTVREGRCGDDEAPQRIRSHTASGRGPACVMACGSATLRAVSPPKTGRLESVSRPICFRTEAWSQ